VPGNGQPSKCNTRNDCGNILGLMCGLDYDIQPGVYVTLYIDISPRAMQ
jgi:hypothetical protein